MDRYEAAVVGGSLVTFLPGISAQQRESVLVALLFSERVTHTDHAGGLVDDWYGYYRRRLQYLGWDALSAEQVHWPTTERKTIVDKALGIVDQVGGERYSSSLSLALPALLTSGDPLRHLERRCKELGIFQLLPCAPSRQGYLDMVIYHEKAGREAFASGFLNQSQDASQVKAELVRFNVRLFQQEHQTRVLKNLERVMVREILAVKI